MKSIKIKQPILLFGILGMLSLSVMVHYLIYFSNTKKAKNLHMKVLEIEEGTRIINDEINNLDLSCPEQKECPSCDCDCPKQHACPACECNCPKQKDCPVCKDNKETKENKNSLIKKEEKPTNNTFFGTIFGRGGNASGNAVPSTKCSITDKSKDIIEPLPNTNSLEGLMP